MVYWKLSFSYLSIHIVLHISQILSRLYVEKITEYIIQITKNCFINWISLRGPIFLVNSTNNLTILVNNHDILNRLEANFWSVSAFHCMHRNFFLWPHLGKDFGMKTYLIRFSGSKRRWSYGFEHEVLLIFIHFYVLKYGCSTYLYRGMSFNLVLTFYLDFIIHIFQVVGLSCVLLAWISQRQNN